LLNLLQSLINIAGLTVASYMDVKTREIEDYVWLLIIIASGPLVAYRIWELRNNYLLSILYALSLIIGIVFAVAIAYLNLMGGADAKALIVLSITEIPSLSKDIFSLIPPLAIFINTTFLSLITIPIILLRNITYYLKKGTLFQGFEKEPLWKKIICIVTAYKVKYDAYLKNKYRYSLAEYAENDTRKLKIGLQIDDESEIQCFALNEEVWVNPLLPLIVFVEAGYILYLLYGCILDIFML